MAVIYLRHPLHGAKVATSEMEAEYDAQNGWEEFDPTQPEDDSPVEPSAAIVEFVPAALEPVNELPRRRGRRPREASA